MKTMTWFDIDPLMMDVAGCGPSLEELREEWEEKVLTPEGRRLLEKYRVHEAQFGGNIA